MAPHRAGATPGYLTEALSGRLGRRIRARGPGTGYPTGGEKGSIGLTQDFDPGETLTAIEEANVNRRRFLAASAYSTAAATLPFQPVQEAAVRTRTVSGAGVVGHADVAAVRDMVELFVAWTSATADGRAAFGRYLTTDVAQPRRGRSPATTSAPRCSRSPRQQPTCAAGRHTTGASRASRSATCLQSLALARASGVPRQDGFVMRTVSQQGGKLLQLDHCLALAESAGNAQGAAPASRWRPCSPSPDAHALAKTGQIRHALADIQLPETALAAGDEVPLWARVWGPPTATVHPVRRRSSRRWVTAQRRPPLGRVSKVDLDL